MKKKVFNIVVLIICILIILLLFNSSLKRKPSSSNVTTNLNTSCTHTATSFHCVKYLKNYDGDTITVEIPGVHPLLGKSISIRVLGLDTPERRTKDPCEKKAAVIVKALVENKLKRAKRIDLMDVKRGKYFRVVARVIADGQDLSKAIFQSGLAYEYDGKTKSAVNWCERIDRNTASKR
ncbi:thermonuclease family protein [bacterium]|nr:thermonuclease family protein [bacterium]